MPNREQPQAMREIAARRILALASRGERNPDRLCAAALVTLNNALPRLPEPAIRIPVQES